MGVSNYLCQVHGIPAKQEEEEGWYILSIIFATLIVVEASVGTRVFHKSPIEFWQ